MNLKATFITLKITKKDSIIMMGIESVREIGNHNSRLVKLYHYERISVLLLKAKVVPRPRCK